jgi:hypothetical protein
VSPNRPIGYLAGQDTARRFSKQISNFLDNIKFPPSHHNGFTSCSSSFSC